MGEFQRHPDGIVYVRTDAGTYADTPENFVRDANTVLLPLPEGANEQVYTQGKRHAFMGDGDVVAGGPMPWPEGDDLISSYEQLKAAQQARQPPEPAPETKPGPK